MYSSKNNTGVSFCGSITLSKRRTTFWLLLTFILISVITLLPLWAIFLASFKPGNDIIRYGLNLTIEPQKFTLKNYAFLFTGKHDFWIWLRNSLFVTCIQVPLTLFVSASVGYGLAAFRFKGRKVVFFLVLLLLMVPFEILMLPMYIETISLKLIDTTTGLILPFLSSATTIFFFHQYIQGIPDSIADSGRIDGCTEYGIFIKLIIPIMKPAFASMAILNCMNSWNNFLWPLLVYKTQNKFTLPIGLNTLLTPYGNNYDLLIVGSVMAILPILVLFLFFQRYFIEGMTAGAVKG